MNITDVFINLLSQKQLDIVEITNLYTVNDIISICDNGFDFQFCVFYEFIIKFSQSAKFRKLDELAQKEVLKWIEANKTEYRDQMENFKDEFYFEKFFL